MASTAAPSQHSTVRTLDSLQNTDEFIGRHIGPDDADISAMLAELQLTSLEQLITQTVPDSIALRRPLALDKPATEPQVLARLKAMVSNDKPARSFIGLGYYDTITPNVILRNVLENPGWYTAYTPYQPEVSQGRLESLLAFQQMILDLTAMDLANASLLDEATAAAEAMALAKRVSKSKDANAFFVDKDCFPQTIDVLKTRAECFGFELIVADIGELAKHNVFGAIFQYPACTGEVRDIASMIEALHAQGAIAVVAADLM
ncbi:MAG: glycine dehydrogenase (aminomethyl-transferring), partial [Pseudohongiellaceae bacterium]